MNDYKERLINLREGDIFFAYNHLYYITQAPNQNNMMTMKLMRTGGVREYVYSTVEMYEIFYSNVRQYIPVC